MSELEWALIPGSPGGYQVNTRGEVVSPRGALLKPQSNGRYGYLSVQLGRGRKEYVHRLVAAAFQELAGDSEVDHIDGDPSNNSIENLRVVTHAENMILQRERKPRCGRGHSFQDAYWRPDGKRECRTCRNTRDAIRRRGTATPKGTP